MPSRADVHRIRAKRLMAVRGSPVTLRLVDLSSGPQPLPSPPRHSGLAVAGAHTAGATTLTLQSVGLTGRVVAGDRFTATDLLDCWLVAASEVADNDDGTIDIPLTFALPASLPDGHAITVDWKNELHLQGQPRWSMGKHLQDGKMIEVRQVKCVLAAIDLTRDPKAQDRLLVWGDERTVVDAIPYTVDGIAVTWELTAR